MEVTKLFRFEKEGTNEHMTSIEVLIWEKVDPQFGLFTWPCAPILSQYLMYNQSQIKNKHVLEIGAGTALPSIVAAKLGAVVSLTEAESFENCLSNCCKSCSINGVEEQVNFLPLSWGRINEELANLAPVDIIIASDCFYDRKNFDDILFTVSYIFSKSPNALFWTTYQLRNCNDTLDLSLMKWKLCCREIPLSAFGADKMFDTSLLTSNHEIKMFEIYP